MNNFVFIIIFTWGAFLSSFGYTQSCKVLLGQLYIESLDAAKRASRTTIHETQHSYFSNLKALNDPNRKMTDSFTISTMQSMIGLFGKRINEPASFNKLVQQRLEFVRESKKNLSSFPNEVVGTHSQYIERARRAVAQARQLLKKGFTYQEYLNYVSRVYSLEIDNISPYQANQDQAVDYSRRVALGPYFQMMPTARDLEIGVFNRVSYLPLFYLGLVSEPTRADGTVYLKANDFIGHDDSHAEFQLWSLSKLINRAQQNDGAGFIAEIKNRKKIVDAIFMPIDRGLVDPVLADSIELFYFFLNHEEGAVPVEKKILLAWLKNPTARVSKIAGILSVASSEYSLKKAVRSPESLTVLKLKEAAKYMVVRLEQLQD